MLATVYGIHWDAKPEEVEENALPNEIVCQFSASFANLGCDRMVDRIGEYLSDTYGFTVKGFFFEWEDSL